MLFRSVSQSRYVNCRDLLYSWSLERQKLPALFAGKEDKFFIFYPDFPYFPQTFSALQSYLVNCVFDTKEDVYSFVSKKQKEGYLASSFFLFQFVSQSHY